MPSRDNILVVGFSCQLLVFLLSICGQPNPPVIYPELVEGLPIFFASLFRLIELYDKQKGFPFKSGCEGFGKTDLSIGKPQSGDIISIG